MIFKSGEFPIANSWAEVFSATIAIVAIYIAINSISIAQKTLDIGIEPNLAIASTTVSGEFNVDFLIQNNSLFFLEDIKIYTDYITYYPAPAREPYRFYLCPLFREVGTSSVRAPDYLLGNLGPGKEKLLRLSFENQFRELMKNILPDKPRHYYLLRVSMVFQRIADRKEFNTVKVFEILNWPDVSYTELVDIEGANIFRPHQVSEDRLEILPIDKELAGQIKNTPIPIASLFCQGLTNNHF